MPRVKGDQEVVYILYDGRANDGDTDDASVYCTAHSLKEAKRDKSTMFPDAVIYRCFIDADNVCRKEERVWDA